MEDDYEHAVTTLEPLARDEQDNLDFLFELGVAYGKVKRPEDSARTFAQMVRAGGGSAQMRLLLGIACLDLEQYARAQRELEKAAALNPKLPFAHYNLGVVYQRLGKPEQAAREFKLEMTLAPDEPWSYESLGTLYLQQRDMDRALEMFGAALKIDPRLPNSLDGVGKVYLERGEPEKAIAYFRRAVELVPDSAKMHFQLGQAYVRTGRREQGQEEITKAQRLQARARKELEEAVSGKLPPPKVGDDEP
jgi:tetratricopeptide (TPR) repeat protein